VSSALRLVVLGVAGMLGACSVNPPMNAVPPYDEYALEQMIEAPAPPAPDPAPIEVEPVEPPIIAEPPAAKTIVPGQSPGRAQSEPPAVARPAPTEPQPQPAPTVALAPPTTLTPPGLPPSVAAPAEPTEDRQMIALLADLQRFNALSADDVRKEIASATTALSRQRTDENRVRLAVLYTLSRTPQDDQRAVLLFENVAKGSVGLTPVKLLAAVLEVQVEERQRAVREEQARANDANRKLDALRDMERALLRDRVRSGGGGGGGGSAGGSGH